jgi:TPR repeat protein
MEKYYLMAIELGNSTAMNSLGIYHQDITNNYKEMEKYFLMAIELGDSTAMNNLGLYHQHITKNYKEMEKYYLMAIELGDSSAMNNLGWYHKTRTKNYKEMEKYYLMSIELGHSGAMYNLGWYHEDITKNYKEMEKYYLMAIELGHSSSAMNNLGLYHQDITKNYKEMEKYFLMAIELGNSTAIYHLKEYCSRIESTQSDVLLFDILSKHYDATENPSDAFLTLYYQHCKKVKKYIQSQIKECLGRPNKTYVYLYEKYIRNKNKNDNASSSCFATDFKIHAIQTKDKEESHSLTYNVHSLVFNSEYFHHLIDNDAFSHADEITMYVSSFAIIDLLLKYLYLSELDSNATDEQIQELYGLSDQYTFEELGKVCKYTTLQKIASAK